MRDDGGMQKVWLVELIDRGHDVTLEVVAPTKDAAKVEARKLHPHGHIVHVYRAVWDHA